MRKRLLEVLSVVACFVFLIPLSHAGTIVIDFGTPLTITTTARQDTFLAALLARANAQGPAMTIEQYLRDIFLATLDSYRQQAEVFEKSDACAKFKVLTAAQQSTITTALGGNNPCR